MAWSPVRRTNAGRFEVDHPGDYATLNSYHPVDGTCSPVTGTESFELRGGTPLHTAGILH
jgi:hypothetical protein